MSARATNLWIHDQAEPIQATPKAVAPVACSGGRPCHPDKIGDTPSVARANRSTATRARHNFAAHLARPRASNNVHQVPLRIDNRLWFVADVLNVD